MKTSALSSSTVFAVLAALLLMGASAWSAPEKKPCSRAQEYITTVEFLRARSEWAIPEPQIRKISRDVAMHCPGSAARFIRVGRLLTEAGLPPRQALELASHYADRKDEVAQRFVALFKKLYLEEQLDLDLKLATTLAHELGAGLDGSLPKVEGEFASLVGFCTAPEGLAQSRPNCARFSADTIRKARNEPAGLFKRWKKTYEFLVSDSGAHLASGPAATLASELVASGAMGPESFIQAYRYAMSEKGLKLERGEALQFSSRLILEDLSGESVATASGLPVERRSPIPAASQMGPGGKRSKDPGITVSTATRRPAQARPKVRR